MSNSFAVDENTFRSSIFQMFVMFGISVLFCLGLLVFYIIHAVNNKSLTSNDRLMWMLLFLFLYVIAFMIYWYLKIWQDKSAELQSTNSEYLDS